MAHLPAMRVLLDGSPVSVDRPTLARALSAGSASARARGRVIIEAKADGVALSDDQIGAPSDEPSEMREVTLTSAEPRALVKVTLDDAAVALRELVNDQKRAAELIHAGKENRAIQALESIFKTWQNVGDIVSHCGALLERRLDAVAFANADTIEAASRRLSSQLQAVKMSLSKQDWSSLADTLEYDLSEEAQQWVRLLSSLADYVGTLPAMTDTKVDAGDKRA